MCFFYFQGLLEVLHCSHVEAQPVLDFVKTDMQKLMHVIEYLPSRWSCNKPFVMKPYQKDSNPADQLHLQNRIVRYCMHAQLVTSVT